MPAHTPLSPSPSGRPSLRGWGFGVLTLAMALGVCGMLLFASPAMRVLAKALGIGALALLALGVALLGLGAVRHLRAALTYRPTEYASPRGSVWSTHLLRNLSALQFADMCTALFEQSGFDSRGEPRSDGVDLWLHSRHAPAAAAFARCRYLDTGQVGLYELQALHGVMVLHRLRQASFVTNTTFTAQAQEFSAAHRIQLRDGSGLLSLMARHDEAQQQALRAIARSAGGGRAARRTDATGAADR